MLNAEKLNKLFMLATGKETLQVQQRNLKKDLSKSKAKKIKDSLSIYKGNYKDPLTAWNKWLDDNGSDIDQDNADDIFGFAEKEFPGSPDQARGEIRNRAMSELDSSDSTVKEQRLRNQMTKAPSWLVNEMAPELDSLSASNSNKNLAKSKMIYSRTLEQKIQNLNLTELDPDVPVEVHLDEMVKLEAMGLLDTARVVNGRLTVVNPNGQIQPAFAITKDIESMGFMDPNSPENQLIFTVAPKIFKPHIEAAISNSSDSTGMTNRASSGAAIRMLRDGSLPIDEWGDALSLINENQSGGIEAGLEGLVKKNPFMNEDEAYKNSIDIMMKYGDIL